MADSELLRELNRDVWHVFRRTYAAGDVAGFLAFHSPDLIRAGGPDKRVYGFDRYATETAEFMARMAEKGDRLAIDFRFVERIASGNLASERGVFRISVNPGTGRPREFYGRFHTFARKADGRWRIAVDYDSNADDSSEGGTVTAERFAAGAEIDDVDRFAG
jgi:ketosteroid isomerase-like protein